MCTQMVHTCDGRDALTYPNIAIPNSTQTIENRTYLFALQGMAGDGGYTFAENQENGVWSYPDGMSLYLGDPVWTNTWSAADVDYDLYFWATFSVRGSRRGCNSLAPARIHAQPRAALVVSI